MDTNRSRELTRRKTGLMRRQKGKDILPGTIVPIGPRRDLSGNHICVHFTPEEFRAAVGIFYSRLFAVTLRVYSWSLFASIRGPYSRPFAVPIRVHSRSLFASIRGPYSRPFAVSTHHADATMCTARSAASQPVNSPTFLAGRTG
jgi:hypothetical protein